MAYKNNVSIRVCGRTMTLSGNESVEYITKVANYIEQKADELRQSDSAKTMNANLISVLTSINIADDFFKEVAKRENIEKEFAAFKQKSAKEIDIEKEKAEKENYGLKSKIDEAENRCAELEKALNDMKAKNSELENKLSENEKALENLKRAAEEMNSVKDGFQSTINRLNDMVAQVNDEKAVIVESLKASEKKNEALEEEIKVKIAKINRLKSIEDKLAAGKLIEVRENV
ncbi:cell division protein ZapA [Anaerotignum faecicola]|nr:cell division protein ZapA [Anaerotignum faecicola]